MPLAHFKYSRRLNFESLEARQLLAAPELLAEGRIVWHSYTDYDVLDGRIHVYDFDDGSHYARATNTIADKVTHAHNPNLSSDGRYMTFMGLPKGPTYGANWRNYLDVFVYDFVTDDVSNLSAQIGLGDPGELEEDPVLSSTGDKVAFKRNVANIWEADVYTLVVRQITSGSGERSGPQYSPDGSELIFWINSGANSLLGRVSLQGTLPTPPLALHNNSGVQDYFPSYWDTNRVLYTSWRNNTERDDDVKIWNMATQVDTFAAFNSTHAEDSDPFGITQALVGFSTTRASSKWQLWYGDPVTGDVASLGISQPGKHNLGAEYTTHKVVYLPPSADFDTDGDVDGGDFLAWQRGYSTLAPTAVKSDGDADHNLAVDAVDLVFWQSQYAAEMLGEASAESLLEVLETSWLNLPVSRNRTFERFDYDEVPIQTQRSPLSNINFLNPSRSSHTLELGDIEAIWGSDKYLEDPARTVPKRFLELRDDPFAWETVQTNAWYSLY